MNAAANMLMNLQNLYLYIISFYQQVTHEKPKNHQWDPECRQLGLQLEACLWFQAAGPHDYGIYQ